METIHEELIDTHRTRINSPPVMQGVGWLKLVREVRDDQVTVFYPNNDSYELTQERTLLLLKQFGVEQLKAEKALDLLWNFYAVRVEVPSGTSLTMEAPQYPETLAPRPLDPVSWIL